MNFKNAIVRPPCSTFADGLTTSVLGAPDLEVARNQHRVYCRALETCGLELSFLDPDPKYPDSTFIEDTAVLTSKNAIVTNPGAPSRRGEILSVMEALTRHYKWLDFVRIPGTVDGGDVCQVNDHFLIGISDRTNEDGADQLARALVATGFTSEVIDIRKCGNDLLHLKSGLSYLGDHRLLVVEALVDELADSGYELVRVPKGEEYAANCIRVNDHVLFPAGFPVLANDLRELGYNLIELEMSEFRKMDGGLSCLSLRF